MKTTTTPTPTHPFLFSALAHNTKARTIADCHIQGRIPTELEGTLYMNGPGIFTRGEHSKKSILDGDGIIQKLNLTKGRAHYSRRFVQTEKLIAEKNRQEFLHPTWTTKSSTVLSNVGGRIKSQAGITVTLFKNQLYALDEVAPAYRLDPQTLETLGTAHFHLPDKDQAIKAHTRYLPKSKSWLLASTRMGRHGMSIDFIRHYANGQFKKTPTVISPRMVYFHDFAATERFALVILQPAFIRPFKFLSGQISFKEALDWQPDKGNIILVIDLETGAQQKFTAPSAWVWHIANAYEYSNQLIMDFVGYDNPEHFLGPDAQLSAIIKGQAGNPGAPGTLRRYVINTHNGQLKQEIIATGSYEFPNIAPESSGQHHHTIYATRGTTEKGIFHHQIAAVQADTGQLELFDFGPETNVFEPVYAYSRTNTNGKAWLITQFLDSRHNRSGFAILDARQLAEGPIAVITLDETLPMSFHGQWVAGSLSHD